MPLLHGRHHSRVLVSLLLAGAAAVAGESEDAIARCAKIASVGDRILCLENGLREASPVTGEQSGHDARTADPVAGTPAPEPEPHAGTAAESANGLDQRPAESPTSVAPESEAAAPAATVSEIGAEQVESRNLTRDERIAALESAENLAVLSYGTVPYERLVVELENGQVWRQIKGDVQRIRVDLERNQTVDISESRFGGYQLRLNEIRRTIRVERIK